MAAIGHLVDLCVCMEKGDPVHVWIWTPTDVLEKDKATVGDLSYYDIMDESSWDAWCHHFCPLLPGDDDMEGEFDVNQAFDNVPQDDLRVQIIFTDPLDDAVKPIYPRSK